MNELIKDIAKNTFRYFDTGRNQSENFYHAFVLCLIVDMKDKYDIRSNHQSGLGRYDICMFSKDSNEKDVVIEFNVINNKKEKCLEETCINALRQIKEKYYINDLLKREVAPSNIYVYGFAFQGKEVVICGGAEETLDWKRILEKK